MTERKKSKPSRDAPTSAAPAAAPAVLRHSGAHKVSVAPGSHSAMSSSPPVAGPRMRASTGPVPASLRVRPAAPVATTTVVRSGTPPAAPAPTAVVRLARAKALLARLLPEIGQPPGADDSSATDLQRRLERLAQGNADVSRQVSALERDIKTAALPPGSAS